MERIIRIPFVNRRLCIKKRCLTLYSPSTYYEFEYKRIPELIIALVIGVIPGTILLVSEINIDIDSLTNGEKIGLMGITLATMGWIITGLIMQRISRKQHTVNILLNHTFSKDHRHFASVILKRYPENICISKSEAIELVECSKNTKTKVPWKSRKTTLPSIKETFYALRVLLNYFEFIAISIKFDDMDGRVLYDYYHGVIFTFCEKSREYIIARRKYNNDPTLYENLIDLYRAWKPSDTFPASETEQATKRT